MAKTFMDCAILFGDSLTNRQDVPGSWHEQLSKAYTKKLDILNRGFGGYTSKWARPLFDEVFARKEENAPVARLVSIWFGTNDATSLPNPQHNTIQDFQSNLTHFLTSLTSPSSPYAAAQNPRALNIVLITPPPVYAPQMDERGRRERTLERTKEFVDVVKALGAEWGPEGREGKGKEWKVGVLDLWGAMEKEVGLGDGLAPYFIDGIHMTTKGYAVLWRLYVNLIKTDWKGRGLDWKDEQDLPRRAAQFEKIDPNRPESAVELLALPECRRM
ncbi:hypothetical protein L198_06953 [Cryptococcus wingfieldii CBS 7118]|uniref:Uncharacterized protein n=1 Tax=Cryptococcus wingfieldii CBS 7118 TaxID=1295528 RepID=A0A1E3IGK9_9TREE|nr:hypothetical protein L198_06953 [Cryptococcus wingfieldii CBS 7118]ODN87723.1 hypothetical protein L198_06953 [Cryptococcus wingfieldii CBS 7118]